MRHPPSRLRSVARPVLGVALGAVSWPADLTAAFAGGLLRQPRLPTMISGWQRQRVRHWIGTGRSGQDEAPTVGRSIGYLWVRIPIGVLSAVVLGLLIYGCWSVLAVLASWLFRIRVPVADAVAAGPVQTATVIALIPVGLVLLFLNLTGIAGVATLDRIAADHWFRPSRSQQLQRRVDELTVSRSDLVRALDSERSRIERDLHDGVQQRVVALGLLVGRARRQLDPQIPDQQQPDQQQPGLLLLDQAQREAAELLDDLRDVAWRVSPAILESEGLSAALSRLADSATPPVHIRWPEPVRLPGTVETCVFHLVSEALTNVARHARATSTEVLIDGPTDSGSGRLLRVGISDDGIGGAVLRPGHGLAGLSSRVEAAGGTLSISSPRSGPTRLEAVLPCE